MIGKSSASAPTPRKIPPFVAYFVIAMVIAASVYANLSFLVTDTRDYQYFPPYQPHLDLNMNNHLGGENLNVARALVAGEGFANPFEEKTGPTAWTTPILPLVLAAIIWVCHATWAR